MPLEFPVLLVPTVIPEKLGGSAPLELASSPFLIHLVYAVLWPYE
ncbi:Lysosomal acid phosphatase precursor [Giardia duodenalis assemblage B]|uniref:Lysosomal acid phosphatase n=1 Tax=Giardia duodenalis assemblage B TaxID=1394984 RepID=A0A132NS48_GIAIN|nr:Lysosomal acid phosphatase precursor [Giardia intestinalis assemblage B]